MHPTNRIARWLHVDVGTEPVTTSAPPVAYAPPRSDPMATELGVGSPRPRQAAPPPSTCVTIIRPARRGNSHPDRSLQGRPAVRPGTSGVAQIRQTSGGSR